MPKAATPKATTPKVNRRNAPSTSLVTGGSTSSPLSGSVPMSIDTPSRAFAENLRLFVYSIDLGPPSFPVIIESSKTVGELKETILNKILKDLMGLSTRQHTLYKVELRDDENLEELALHTQKEELDMPSCELSKIFPVKPPKETINIILRTANDRPKIMSHWSLRSDTVRHLYEILRRERFVQVRGTPGSGKTTLKILLQDYILKNDSNAAIRLFQGWDNPENDYEAVIGPLPSGIPTYLLFDEAQDTYNDMHLWNDFFKTVHDKSYDNCYVMGARHHILCILIEGAHR